MSDTSTPPPRPHKSKLRSLSASLDQISALDLSLESPRRTRFTEQFDSHTPLDETSLIINEFALPPRTRNASSLELPLDPVTNRKTSTNRASLLIARLEGWYHCLKSILAWLEEVSRASWNSSRSYDKAFGYLDERCAHKAEPTNQSILTLQAGLQVLTMQLVEEQAKVSRRVEKFRANLVGLRKEVKEKIQRLKNSQGLGMEEFLRRADATKAKLKVLYSCCKKADGLNGKIETDPWLANLLVLRQLKREVDEENRLRLLMVPIQQEVKDIEQRILQSIKPAIEYCYRQLAPDAWDGTKDPNVAPFRLVMDRLTPLGDWNQFVEKNQNELVDEDNPIKNYLKINYPNKFHPLVKVLLSGKLERRIGGKKVFIKRQIVVTTGGYLHEFPIDSPITPERTLYIPTKTVTPSIDIQYLEQDPVFFEYGHVSESDLTFDIATQDQQKRTTYKVSTKAELIVWARTLMNLTQHAKPYSPYIMTSSTIDSRSSSQQEIPKPQPQPQPQFFPIFSPTLDDLKRRSFLEEALPNTDTESFVTAQLGDNDSDDGRIDESFVDYFNLTDDESVHSNETARASDYPASSAMSQVDDTRSSVYYSSHSAPPSPTLSDSSIPSIPEFDLVLSP